MNLQNKTRNERWLQVGAEVNQAHINNIFNFFTAHETSEEASGFYIRIKTHLLFVSSTWPHLLKKVRYIEHTFVWYNSLFKVQVFLRPTKFVMSRFVLEQSRQLKKLQPFSWWVNFLIFKKHIHCQLSGTILRI